MFIDTLGREIADALAVADDDDLCSQNLPLALHMAKKFARKYPRIDCEEIISECFVALALAARGFDPDNGRKFSTYFGVVARNQMHKLFAKEHNHDAAIPRKTMLQVLIMRKWREENGTWPTLEEVNSENLFSRQVPVDEKRYRQVMQAVTLTELATPAHAIEESVWECRRIGDEPADAGDEEYADGF
ncbi:hypothetical protein DTL42_19415 [Bremerella cremea]|uniref:RNA polymerase sigma-70 region 2 domain-containing protein n=1 Tax=Bremerella cremea TaxID=1031537 RepID=A0A368KM54_9BACT|nr:sigma factor [Bremerella cremea]RCS42309.1 hypothetical protein DTL42_19415 [Bremerella cremea]